MSDKEIIPTPLEEAVNGKPPESLLEQLAAKRQEISETKEVSIPVPGYDTEPPLLLIRYKLLDGSTLTKMALNLRRQNNTDRWIRALHASIDTFIIACVGFYVDLGDGNPEPLTYQGEHLTGFNSKLAEALQFKDELHESAGPRDVVMALFGYNDVAITQHAYLLNRWFQNTALDVNQEMLLEGNL